MTIMDKSWHDVNVQDLSVRIVVDPNIVEECQQEILQNYGGSYLGLALSTSPF
jgi:hypothetical protein